MTSPDAPSPHGPLATHAVVQQAIAQHQHLDGALLPILHAVQHALGHVPREALPQIAQALNLSRAEVHGVVTYYHHFRTTPPGRTVVQVCRAEACRSMGGEELLAHARATLGCSEEHTVSADGAYSVEAAYCLGLCASSPAVMVGDVVRARMTPQRLDALVGAGA